MITFEDLNENQRRAMEWSGGPLLMLAGPGSGKTGVLTLRLARLLEENEDASALALTFTNKAAVEMRDRVDRLLGRRSDRVKLCTFHSFATDILAQHGSHFGIRSDFQVLSRIEDRIAVLEDTVKLLPGVGRVLPPDRMNILDLIDRLFAESYSGEVASGSLATIPPWLPRLFRCYIRSVIRANQLDFGSLLYLAVRLLREKPAVARVVRLGWTHIFVDEFQDSNRAQYDLLRLVAPTRSHNLFVVADDDQIIYQWNGASPRRLQELRRHYELRTVQVPECYRCPPRIVTLANRLIAHNTRRIAQKRIIPSGSACSSRDVIRYRTFPSARQEAKFVLQDLETRVLHSSDSVVLGRTNRLVRRFAERLGGMGCEAYVPQRKSEFDSPVLNILVEALRLANFRHDRVVLRRICHAWEGLTGEVIDPEGVAAAAALVGGDFLRAWIDSAAALSADGNDTPVHCIRAGLLDQLQFPKIVDTFLNGGWRSWNGALHAKLTEEEIAIWKDLHGDIIAESGSNVSLNTYLQRLDLSSKISPPRPGALRCMTIHQAKGLEFEHVYLIGMAQNVFPSYRATQAGMNSAQFEEERRSCFVAITRTRKTLTMTRTRKYFGYRKGPSQFLREMGVEAE